MKRRIGFASDRRPEQDIRRRRSYVYVPMINKLLLLRRISLVAKRFTDIYSDLRFKYGNHFKKFEFGFTYYTGCYSSNNLLYVTTFGTTSGALDEYIEYRLTLR